MGLWVARGAADEVRVPSLSGRGQGQAQLAMEARRVATGATARAGGARVLRWRAMEGQQDAADVSDGRLARNGVGWTNEYARNGFLFVNVVVSAPSSSHPPGQEREVEREVCRPLSAGSSGAGPVNR